MKPYDIKHQHQVTANHSKHSLGHCFQLHLICHFNPFTLFCPHFLRRSKLTSLGPPAFPAFIWLSTSTASFSCFHVAQHFQHIILLLSFDTALSPHHSPAFICTVLPPHHFPVFIWHSTSITSFFFFYTAQPCYLLFYHSH